MSDQIRILVVDNQAIVRAGIRLLLERNPLFCVVGDAAAAAEAVGIAEREQPAIILVDPDLGTRFDLELISGLLKAAPQANVLILTGVRDVELHAQAVRLGARGVIPKTQTPDMLFKAIPKVLAGEMWLDRAATAHLVSHFSRRPDNKREMERRKIATLTDRETEVIALISQGLKNKQIAERLSISEVTVRHHLSSIFSKLGISDRLELLLYAYQYGLASPPPSHFFIRSDDPVL